MCDEPNETAEKPCNHVWVEEFRLRLQRIIRDDKTEGFDETMTFSDICYTCRTPKKGGRIDSPEYRRKTPKRWKELSRSLRKEKKTSEA